MARATLLLVLVVALAAWPAAAQLTTPQKISATVGDSRGYVEERFGLTPRPVLTYLFDQTSGVAHAGDVDGDGVDDLALVSERSSGNPA